ncbi:hypothetical protein H257_03418 [Aphanomyces astaci]|uniref:[phosphatase 2A protein]-leucine-carboxy methyltransferase n=1 Tax=Aphanomyces astaci TaxID=112090 RepID=W4GYX4_APHAT|nr:hypothetical protein H257_03418 [Aphanomyces astaci]ETV84108.1 hypothetical protein H257_03418 [Aphanomyces astaci]|eukprot:XP_009825800.1 hypothetical protein H257_03418 [Aphanomyces astaci]
MANTSDHGVAETAFDAIRCKISAVNQGYFHDPFACHFDKKATRRIPLIHRGYYLRHIAVERAVSLFLQAATDHHGDGRPVQIVSLGAGFDTLFFRLAGKTDTGHPPVRMFEVDCESISSQKVALLKASPSTFFGANGQVTATDTTTLAATVRHDNGNTSTYVAFACDLGNVTLLARHLAAHGLDPTLPTLVLAECVLAYLTPEASTSLLRWAAEAVAECMFVAYDPIGLTDSSTFGVQLQQYFDNKGCALRSASIMPSVQGYARLLRHVGWRCIRLGHMNAIYDALTTSTERRRVNTLEPFDELEDWVLTNHHYGVLVASNNMNGPAAATSSLQAVLAWPSTVAGSSTSYHQSPDSAIVTIRAFEQGDERDVRYLFETGHLPTSSKSVRKLVAKALQSDMANISQVYLGPLSGFWVATVHDSSASTTTSTLPKVVGCVGLKPHHGTVAELCRLGVASDMRRHGIASKLVDALEQHAFDACGYTSIVLDTLGTMEAAKAFYVHRGYAHAGSATVGNEGLVIETFEKRRGRTVD